MLHHFVTLFFIRKCKDAYLLSFPQHRGQDWTASQLSNRESPLCLLKAAMQHGSGG